MSDAINILMADDDMDDCLLLKEAVAEAGLPHRICFVSDGEELLDYVYGLGKYETPGSAPRPNLILLDLNMPRKGGRQVLQQLKRDRRLQRVPVVVLTSSMAEDDIGYCYDAGASSYIPKPASFQGWVDLITTLNKYWFELVKLPPSE